MRGLKDLQKQPTSRMLLLQIEEHTCMTMHTKRYTNVHVLIANIATFNHEIK
jgi:hypothetical protein